MKNLLALALLLASSWSSAQIKVFEPGTNIKASEVNANFNYIKQLFQAKQTVIPFSVYNSNDLIDKERLDGDFALVRLLGVDVSTLSEMIKSEEINQAFVEMKDGALNFNDAPTVSNNNYSTNEDITLVNLLSFVNITGESVVALQSPPTHGSVSFNSALKQFTYIPSLNYNGLDSFTYLVQDGAKSSPIATVSLSVIAVNDAPVLSNISNLTFNEDTISSPQSFTISDIDNNLSCSSLSASSSNPLVIANSGIVFSGTSPNCSLTVINLLDKVGSSSITVTLSDGLLQDSKVFTATITGQPDAPVTSNFTALAFNEDTQSLINLPYTDAEGDLATSCSISDLSNLSISQACSCSSGICSVGVTGLLNTTGAASFKYSVTALGQVSNLATVSATLNAVNDAPVVTPLTVSPDINVAYSGAVSATDVDSAGPFSFNVTVNPTRGVLTSFNSATGAFTYTPNLNNYGLDTFTVTASDGALSSTPVVVSINVIGKGIVELASGRIYFDGELGRSCEDYRTKNVANYQYVGATGDGYYRIQPNTAPSYKTYCYMSTPFGLGTNIMRSLPVTITQVNATYPWMAFNAARVNDDVDTISLATAFGYTGDAATSSNINRGIEMTFQTSQAVKAIKLSTYFVQTAFFRVEFFNGSSWVIAMEAPQRENQEGVFYFNENGTQTSTRWRWYISSFPAGTGQNFYGAEIRLYK